MKKIYIGISILLGMLLLICLPNSVWAEDKKVEKIVVTIPEPVIDKQICMDASQITLKVNDEEKINIEKIEWEKKTYEGEYEAIKNTNELAEISHFYKAKVTFKLPENYTKDNDIKVIINDESSEAQKEISKIEATGSELIVGEKLIYDVSKYNVTLDGNEKASVTEIVWEYADGSKCTENTIVEAGKKYRFAADPATHSETSCSGQLCFNLGLCGNHGRLCIAVGDCLAGDMGNCCSCNGHCSVGEYDLSALVCVFRQPESIDFCTAADGFGRNWLFFYFRPAEWFPF